MKQGVLVFVHGWQGDRTVWNEVIAALEPDVEAIAIDLPGSGDASAAPGPYTVELFANAVRHEIESRGVAPVVLVGHSMGAKIALQLASEAPQLVRRLVLIAPVPAGLANFSERGQAYLRATAGDPVKVREWLLKTVTENCEPETLERLCHVAARTTRDAALEALESWTHTDLAERAKTVAVPGLVIAPEYDQPDKARARVADLLPNASFAVLPGAAHYSIVEHPSETANLMREWLRHPSTKLVLSERRVEGSG
jgi:pimeloyl-ACP methyl ester carboxylesterase